MTYADRHGRPRHTQGVLGALALPERDDTDVLAHERTGNHFGTGTNVLFGDGRCKFMSDSDAAYLIAELQAGFNPPRKRP